MEQITVAGYEILVERKNTRRLRMTILPPRGQIRVTASPRTSQESIRRFVSDHLDWIEKNTARFRENSQRPPHTYTSGEMFRLFGQPLTLQIQPGPGYHARQQGSRLVLTVPENASPESRRRVIEDWYADRLKEALPPLVQRWEKVLGVHASGWRIRSMTSRWGSCSRATGFITLNLRLAAMPKEFLEYVVVHELCHFHVAGHNKEFWGYVARCLPDWQDRRHRLNSYYEDQFGD